MFLDRLEMQGFKSFVDKTLVQFGAGITGVVGPNGCGKTNVSDAIRWVMGEQSAKQLRGDSMEDVIFNGCPTRKPIGMAEVHLTFRNDRGILPTEFSEVTVSRRVFRSGVSEYYLNKTPCRLKDIRDLFFDTGMGSHAYSVIERHMVDHVLSDSSGHRRFLFEEASGITKYKARKKEALNKLEATDGDLVRLNDIVFEIERELRSLARQVGKARRFQRLRDGIRDLDLTLTSGRVLELRRGIAEAADRWQEEAVRREGVVATLDTLEAGLNDRKLALLELERELSVAQGGLKDREEARLQAEHQIVLLEERASGLRRRAAEAAAEAARMRERLGEVIGQEREAAEQRDAARRAGEDTQVELLDRERELSEVDRQLREQRDHASQHKQDSLDLFSTEAEKRGVCERLKQRETFLAERRSVLTQRLAEMAQRLADIDSAQVRSAGQRVELEHELEAARQRLHGVVATIEALEGERRTSEQSMARARQEIAVAESRLEMLLDLKRNFEGLSEGVKAIVHDRPEGVAGVLADVVEIPTAELDAIAAALGDASSWVLAEGAGAVAVALTRLRALEAGRATVVDCTAFTPGTRPAEPAGVRGRAADLVRCDARFRGIVDRLLASVFVVGDAVQAAELALRHPELRFVTASGEVWEHGVVRAGRSGHGSLLHREQEIRELTGRIAEMGLELEGQERELQALDARHVAALAGRAVAEGDVDAGRQALEAIARQHEASEREREWASAEQAERGRETASLDTEAESLVHSRGEAEADLAAFQVELDSARARLTDLDGVVRRFESDRDAAALRVQELRERLLQLSRDAGECDARWARAEQTRRELEAGLEARGSEERQALGSVQGLDAEVSGVSAGLEGLRSSEQEQRMRVDTLRARFGAEKEEVQVGEDEARRLRFQHTELSELLHQLELDRVTRTAEVDRTFERLRTEYDMDVAAWQPVLPPAEFDPATAETELESSRQRLRTLGVVNLLALEEYGKKRERWQFLTQQREDLIQAKGQLLEAIEKINVTASQLFVETFEKVQGHFRDIFKTLFEGGDSELRAVGDDPLECEIEIVAKPRGKHLQSISLMSGGERALTAIALLFAIYLVKPSPFCLLDEVDAPLDDANVDRFVRMLKRFSDRTQFVIITHNKKTMEQAACLYGVTMQELGVSRLVSVRFDRGREEPSQASVAATMEDVAVGTLSPEETPAAGDAVVAEAETVTAE